MLVENPSIKLHVRDFEDASRIKVSSALTATRDVILADVKKMTWIRGISIDNICNSKVS